MLYRYKAFTKEGKTHKGTIQAGNEAEAKVKLKGQELFVVELEEKKEFKLFTPKLPVSDLAIISRDLALYLRAGIQISYALNLIKSSYEKKSYDFLEAVMTLVNEGNSFYNSLKTQKIYILPAFYLESVKVAEENGFLDKVLIDLSKFLLDQEKVKSQIVSSMTYPAFLLVVALNMVFVMLTYIVPQIVTMFENLDQELPTITKVVLAISNFLQDNIVIVIAVILLSLISFISALKLSLGFKQKVDAFLLKTPFFGSLILRDELAKFSHIVALLSTSGVTFTKAIYLASSTMNNLVIKNAFLESSTKVVEGQKLSSTLAKYKLVNKSFIQALVLAEETSQVKEVLNSISVSYFEDNGEKIKRFLGLFEPFLMLFIGGIIGVIIVAMLLPIFSINIGR